MQQSTQQGLEQVKPVADALVDMTPVGVASSVTKGEDASGKKLSVGERFLEVGASFLPFLKAGKVLKGVETADDLMDARKAAKAGANWKSVKQFGHTFTTHGAGAKNTRNLTGRARGTGDPQGQWLDNQKAADFLSGLKVDGPATVRIPDGLAQVIMPDGSIVPANWARIVPTGDGLKTAFPVVPVP
jgi:hypothetical protein